MEYTIADIEFNMRFLGYIRLNSNQVETKTSNTSKTCMNFFVCMKATFPSQWRHEAAESLKFTLCVRGFVDFFKVILLCLDYFFEIEVW